MKLIISSIMLLLMTTLLAGAEEKKSTNINTTGIIHTIEGEPNNLKFVTDDGATYYIYTVKVIGKLRPFVDKRVSINAQVIPTKTGAVEHIVWLNDVSTL